MCNLATGEQQMETDAEFEARMDSQEWVEARERMDELRENAAAPASSTAAPSHRPVRTTGDALRDSTREAIAQALGVGMAPAGERSPAHLAEECETAMHEELSAARYRARARSLTFNLRDPKNKAFLR